MARKLLLIDLSGIFWSAHHATVDEPVSAAFEKTVGKVHQLAHGYDFVAGCCDAPPYKRKTIHPAYKAQRDAPPPQAVEQFRRVKERLDADGFLLWASPGAEADDVIATAVRLAVVDGLDVTVASSDKDLLSLVDDEKGVRCLSLATGDFVDRAAVIAKFGVDPSMMVDSLSLSGDRSDNVPGADGVGPKTAAKLLLEFGDLEGVIQNAERIKTPALRQSVLNAVDAVRLAKQLITLDNQVPIKWEELYAERKQKPISRVKGFDEADDAEFEPEENEPVKESTAEKKPEPEIVRPKVIQPTTALALAPAEWSMQLEPRDSRGAVVLSKHLFESRLFGGFANEDAILAVILRGRSLGLDATTALSSFHVIKGRPVMHAGLIIGLVLKSGHAEYFDLVETSDQIATWVTKRKGSSREVKLSWTIEEAFEAGLVRKGGAGFTGGGDSNWDKYRRTMLRWRAGTELARAVYPDIVLGLYDPNEIQDGAFEESA